MRVERQHRIRLPSPLGLILPWLSSGEPVDCLVLIGAAGGVSIVPEASLSRHRALMARINEMQFSLEESEPRIVDYARYAATTWKLRLRRETTRYSFTLPEEARALGVAPSAKQDAAVFAARGLLEVWPAKEWVNYVRGLAVDLDQLQDQIEELISDDGDQ